MDPKLLYPLKRRGEEKKWAAAAVARKLSVLLHRLWMSGEVYEPLRNARHRSESREEAAQG